MRRHTPPLRRASLAAETLLPHPPEHVYAFLARLENHWLLHDRYLRLEQLSADGRGSRIVIHTPLGVHRTACATVTTTHDPDLLGGTATIGRHTTARVNWTIERQARGASVELKATILTASTLDKLQLALGGRWWLQRRFHRVLARLADALSPETAPSPPSAGRCCDGSPAC